MMPTVLLVDDSRDDVLFMRRAFARCGVPHALQVLEDGCDALAYLAGRNQFADRALYPLPALVILDLKMPLLGGFEVLRWVRTQPEFAAMILVVLTSSDHPSDVRKAYALGANSFLSKPGHAGELAELVRCLAEYWLKRNVANSVLRLRQRKLLEPELPVPAR